MSTYFHYQGMDLRQDLRGGIIMGNQSLVLQSLGRNATGNYYCVATNSEGTAFSNPVQLDIKCTSNNYHNSRPAPNIYFLCSWNLSQCLHWELKGIRNFLRFTTHKVGLDHVFCVFTLNLFSIEKSPFLYKSAPHFCYVDFQVVAIELRDQSCVLNLPCHWG